MKDTLEISLGPEERGSRVERGKGICGRAEDSTAGEKFRNCQTEIKH